MIPGLLDDNTLIQSGCTDEFALQQWQIIHQQILGLVGPDHERAIILLEASLKDLFTRSDEELFPEEFPEGFDEENHLELLPKFLTRRCQLIKIINLQIIQFGATGDKNSPLVESILKMATDRQAKINSACDQCKNCQKKLR